MHFLGWGVGIEVGMEEGAWLHLKNVSARVSCLPCLDIVTVSHAATAATQNSPEAVSAISQMEAICWQAGLGVGGVRDWRLFHLIVKIIQHPVFVIPTCLQLQYFQNCILSFVCLTGCYCYFLIAHSYSLLGYNHFAVTFSSLPHVQGNKTFPNMHI